MGAWVLKEIRVRKEIFSRTLPTIRTCNVELSELTIGRLNDLRECGGAIFLDRIPLQKGKKGVKCERQVAPNSRRIRTSDRIHRDQCILTTSTLSRSLNLKDPVLAIDNLRIEARWRVRGHLHP